MIRLLLWVGPFFIISLLLFPFWIFACMFDWWWFFGEVAGRNQNPLSLWWGAR